MFCPVVSRTVHHVLGEGWWAFALLQRANDALVQAALGVVCVKGTEGSPNADVQLLPRHPATAGSTATSVWTVLSLR